MWKQINDYPDYEINEQGEVRRGNRLLKSTPSTNGYKRVSLCKDGKVKDFRIHRLMAQHFIHNLDNKPQVNHIDGDLNNNSLSNLEWVTASENLLHAIHVTKTHNAPLGWIGKFGKEHNRSKSFWIEDKYGVIKKYGSGLEFTRLTGLDHSAISYARTKSLSSYRFVRGKMKGLVVHFEIMP